jgi:hypothetical protein
MGTANYRRRHRLGQNSILSRVKTMQIHDLIREKKQRFEVIRGVQGIYRCVLRTVLLRAGGAAAPQQRLICRRRGGVTRAAGGTLCAARLEETDVQRGSRH